MARAMRGLPLSLVLLLGACAGHSDKTLEARTALDAGRDREALALYNEALDVEKASEPVIDIDDGQSL